MDNVAVRVFEGSFGQVLVLSLDIMGTFAFAVSGASAGVKRELDLFGVLLLSFAAAVAGGIARDMLIGAIPPAALSDWRYLATALVAGALTFWCNPLIDRLKNPCSCSTPQAWRFSRSPARRRHSPTDSVR